MNWDGISSVSLYWANLEMIKFWASSSPGKGPQRTKIVIVNLAIGDITAESPNSVQ